MTLDLFLNVFNVYEGSVDQSEDQILAEELAALGASSGGSGHVVRLVARLMRKNVHEIDLLVPLPFDDVLRRVTSVLGKAGHAVATVPVDSREDEETIRVVTGGGAGGLNPVVVTARVLKADEVSTEVWLRAAAKEGLIRQRAGEKTAVRFAALLSEATGADRAGG
ncbi:hypothetical protein ACWD0Z_34960 [Streptomyces sp. NPDC003007]